MISKPGWIVMLGMALLAGGVRGELIAHYRFADNLQDSSGSATAHPLLIGAGSVSYSDDVPWNLEEGQKAVVLDGASWITTDSIPAMPSQTYAFWIRIRDVNRHYPFSKSVGSDGVLRLNLDVRELSGGGHLLFVSTGTSVFISDAGPVPHDEWVHMALTYNAQSGDYVFYLNGNVERQGNRAGVNMEGSLYFGRRGLTPEIYPCHFADVRVYSRVLSAMEINALATRPPPRLRFYMMR